MYRHLAHWPSFLALSWTLLAPPHADGRLAAAIAACLSGARREAAAFALPGSIAVLPTETHAAVQAALARFADDVLPRMIVICGLLRGTLDG
jgi:hypothetical protein